MRKLSIALALAVAPLTACNEAPQEDTAPVVDTRTSEEIFNDGARFAYLRARNDESLTPLRERESLATQAYYEDDRSYKSFQAKKAAEEALKEATDALFIANAEAEGNGDLARAYIAKQNGEQSPAASTTPAPAAK